MPLSRSENVHLLRLFGGLTQNKVKLNYEEDRKQKMLLDKLEKERREAREAARLAAAAQAASLPTASVSPDQEFPVLGGRTLSQSPPYEHNPSSSTDKAAGLNSDSIGHSIDRDDESSDNE